VSSPQGNDSKPADQGAVDGRKFRAGHLATFRVDDPVTGQQVTGHGLVLAVTGDYADLAVIGTAHVRAHVDQLVQAKLETVPNLLPQPEPAADGS
jgi:hypothetical protein